MGLNAQVAGGGGVTSVGPGVNGGPGIEGALCGLESDPRPLVPVVFAPGSLWGRWPVGAPEPEVGVMRGVWPRVGLVDRRTLASCGAAVVPALLFRVHGLQPASPSRVVRGRESCLCCSVLQGVAGLLAGHADLSRVAPSVVQHARSSV